MPLAEGMQNLRLRELIAIRPVGEANIDDLFQEVERIRELYARAGSHDVAVLEKWVAAAIQQNLPDSVTTILSNELRQVTAVDYLQNIVITHLHDYRIGLPRGHAGTMLYPTEGDTRTQYPDERPKDQIAEADKQKEERHNDEDNQFAAVVKGRGKGKGGETGKGYGKCWHCGESGHPRWECLEWLKLQNEGDVSAPKGDGDGYKGNNDKGKRGKGKG